MKLINVAKDREDHTTEVSFTVTLLIAKTGQLTTTQKLVKPVSKLMTNIMLGEKVKWAFGKNPLSKAYHLEKQLLSCVRASVSFGFRLDESTDVRGHTSISYRCVTVTTEKSTLLQKNILLSFCFDLGGSWFFLSHCCLEKLIGSSDQSPATLAAGKVYLVCE